MRYEINRLNSCEIFKTHNSKFKIQNYEFRRNSLGSHKEMIPLYLQASHWNQLQPYETFVRSNT